MMQEVYRQNTALVSDSDPQSEKTTLINSTDTQYIVDLITSIADIEDPNTRETILMGSGELDPNDFRDKLTESIDAGMYHKERGCRWCCLIPTMMEDSPTELRFLRFESSILKSNRCQMQVKISFLENK